MEKKIIQSRYFFILMLGAAAMLALFIANRTTAEDYTLPPRNDNAVNQAALPVGGRLQLKARFSADWPWETMQWQTLWTMVQWQDDKGEWLDVAGWQGNLDNIAQEESGWAGAKEWWAGQEILGTGPYRWLIYTQPGGDLLATSEPFYLANTSGGLVTVDVELTP